jgi:hypothetical protein
MSWSSDLQEIHRLPLAVILIGVGSLLLAIAAGMVWVPAGVAVAGALSLWFGIDASRDVIAASREAPELRVVSEAS